MDDSEKVKKAYFFFIYSPNLLMVMRENSIFRVFMVPFVLNALVEATHG